MTDEQSPPKICVVCGKDCSHERRIKDEHGRYYHKECFKRAKQERQAKEAIFANKEQEVDLAPSDEIEPYDLDIEGRDEPRTAYADATETAGPTMPCPNCHAPIPEGALACARCGYNLATGKRLPSTYAEMAAARLGDVTGGRVWPVVIGLLSVAIGIGGLVFYPILLADSLPIEEPGPYSIGKVVVAGTGVLLALLIVLTGIGVWRRKQMAMVWLQRWAALKTFLTLAAVVFLGIGILFLNDFAGSFDADYGTDTAAAGLHAILVPGIITLVWILLWPVFILSWYSRETVQKQIGDWR